jgi:uncharacterized protein HemX
MMNVVRVVIGLIPAAWRSWAALATVLAVLGLLGGVYVHIEGQGYQRAQRHYEREMQRIQDANQKAIEKADRVYADRVKDLTVKNKELEHALEEVDRESANAPGSTDLGLSVDSVRRLNRIR